MELSRKHPNAGIRCPGHDYRSRCIYHIVLNKADSIPDFSAVKGIPGDRQWPPIVELSLYGRIIGEALSSLKSSFPFTSILRRCIMPDHVHFVIFIHKTTEIHLGEIIAEMKKICSSKFEAQGHKAEIEFFIPGYYDIFLTGKDQLKKMLAYVSDNPRRYLVRKSKPGWFRKFIIENAEKNKTYEAYGNWDLISEFQRVPVKVSRK
ncbi:MAG: transposase, partial [Muribaculaceae bacterium]|nr:transposase [Muribaculaceae bacterium]